MSKLSDKIYSASPIWVQQIGVAIYGWWWFRRRFGGDFPSFLNDFRERERWTAEQFRTYHIEKLGTVLKAAWSSSYYQEVFMKAEIKPNMHPLEVLKKLPILSKDNLRTRAKDLLTCEPPRKTITFKSSGTTGTPTEIFYTQEFHTLTQALFTARNLEWAGVSYHDRRVMFGVRKVCRFDQEKPPFWRFSPAENMAYASIYHLSPRFLPHYISFLRDFRPVLIMGYPSALHSIARYALDHNDLPAPAKAVITTSETVTDQIREAIEAAWQCKIYDQYCSVEDSFFVSQCEYGRYHVSPEMGIIEIVDLTGQPVSPGVMGQVICTGLQNLLQPLIRYQIGDVARLSTDQTCKCGRQMPILEAIDGRFEDICYTPDGREMLRFDTVFKGVENIREAQVVQEGFDLFVINVVPGEKFGSQDIIQIKHNMRLHVGDAHILVKPVDSIPRSASGKFRGVICNLSVDQKKIMRNVSVGRSSPK